MGYFDGLSSASFKRDEAGNAVFYRWGILGKGHTLPNAEKEAALRAFVRRFYQVTLPAVIGAAVIFSWRIALLVSAILYVWFYLGTASLLKDLPLSASKLTLSESYASAATAHGAVGLWIALACTVLFVVGGLLLIMYARSDSDFQIGLLSTLFFGAGAAVLSYMIRARRA